MRLLDYSFRSPTQNLAFDEVLLNAAEIGKGGDVLRFWESQTNFVVLGVSQALRQETQEKNCLEDHVRILRRASAGGCVLQGPGCLNYTLVLSHENHPEINTIRGSYCFILERICEALHRRGVTARHKGISDLAVGGKKVSGCAQKRRRHSILHHGTLLYDVDYDKLERYLREPTDRPQYRGERTHRGFVKTIPLSSRQLREAVCEAFEMEFKPAKPLNWELDAVKALARERYSRAEWILRR
jgi:lipoate-protein ligase A